MAGAGVSAGLNCTHRPWPKMDLNSKPKGRSMFAKQEGKPVAAQVRWETSPQSNKKKQLQHAYMNTAEVKTIIPLQIKP